MIPEAAIMAAAEMLEMFSDFTPELARRVARTQLEAAAPHMRQAFYLEMNLRAVQDELRAAPIYQLGKIEDKRP